MSSKYDDLEKLRDLFAKGIITEAEFNTEKERILNGSSAAEMNVQSNVVATDDNRSYNALMHLSQFSNYIFPFLGLIVPIVMWATRKNESRSVDLNGKIILNWNISAFIYLCVFITILVVAIVGATGTFAFTSGNFEGMMEENPFYAFRFLGMLGVAILPLIAIGILDFIFTIIGAVKASNGEVWNYPLSIRFFKISP